MKKPTIEEVKAYFKDAKKVDDNVNVCIIDIDTIRYDRFVKDVIVCNSDCNLSGLTTLYNSGGYSKIISYKSNPNIDLSKLTTDHVVELCKEPNIKEFMINNGVVKNELEVGKWYKSPKYGQALFCLQEVKELRINAYGFDYNGVWHNLVDFGKLSNERELATPQEVATALKNEAVKKYKMGDKIEPIENLYYGGSKMIIDNLNFKYNFEDNLLFVEDEKEYAVFVFNKGVWADPIKEETYIKIPLSIITLTDSDKNLGRLVRTIAENY
jgi:hypothetical protein